MHVVLAFLPVKQFSINHWNITLLQKGDIVPVDNPFNPGCSNQDYEAGTKGLRLYTIPPTPRIWLFMWCFLFVLTYRELFGPGWWYHPELKSWSYQLFCLGWSYQPELKKDLWSGLMAQTGQKALPLHTCPASRWTRDKSLHWSRVQRRAG